VILKPVMGFLGMIHNGVPKITVIHRISWHIYPRTPAIHFPHYK